MPLDESLFAEHMRDANLLEMTLKGHLWVESCLNRALEVSLKLPDRVEIDRLQFSAKLGLCLATGALAPDNAPALRHLNKLRNRLAHDLHSAIGADDVTALEQSLAGALSEVHMKVRKEGEATARLRIWFYAVLMFLEYRNMVTEYRKINHMALQSYHLVLVLEQRLFESSGRTPTPREELRKQHGVPPEPNPRDAWMNYSDYFGVV